MGPISGGQGQSVDMNRIMSGIYLGSQSAEEGPVASLKSHCITHVLQLGTGPNMQPTHANELTYKCISVPDDEASDIVALLLSEERMNDLNCTGAMEFIDEGRKNGCVLVHCQLGMSRSATTVLAYLMLRQGMTFWEALVDVLKRRKIVQPNMGFCRQLMGLERCMGDVTRYSGPAKGVLLTDQDWLKYIDRARSG